VIDTLVADVAAHDWHLNVGIVGIKYVAHRYVLTGTC
jgi:hypothetical protein